MSAKHTEAELKELQSLPLERKIGIAQARIAEMYNYTDGRVYVSFSGGKDSTVLMDIVRGMYPEVPGIFADTGLEYPEIREFVRSFENILWVRPEKSFKRVLEEKGYPIISKTVATTIEGARKGSKCCTDRINGLRPDGTESPFLVSRFKKWKWLLDAPFKISEKCCYHLKQKTLDRGKKALEKKYGGEFANFTGIFASESMRRTTGWLQYGCNIFTKGKLKSRPLSVWTESDVLEYIVKKGIKIASCYGRIYEKKGKYYISSDWEGETRTGCMFCLFGVQCERQPNRFQRMYITHPDLWRYCMEKLGIREVLEYLGVPYVPTPEQEMEMRLGKDGLEV